MNDLEKVKQRIKKMLAMAEHKNSNVNEAARAASMAAKLMSEYEISHADILRTELNSNIGLTDTPLSGREYNSWPRWMQTLSVSTAKLFECEVKFKRTDLGKKYIVLMGFKSDVLMVQWMYEFLHDELIRLSVRSLSEKDKHISARRHKTSFLFGAVGALCDRFETIIKDREIERASGCRDLMVIKKNAITNRYGKTEYKENTSFTANANAYDQGEKAGKKININRPLGNTKNNYISH